MKRTIFVTALCVAAMFGCMKKIQVYALDSHYVKTSTLLRDGPGTTYLKLTGHDGKVVATMDATCVAHAGEVLKAYKEMMPCLRESGECSSAAQMAVNLRLNAELTLMQKTGKSMDQLCEEVDDKVSGRTK